MASRNTIQIRAPKEEYNNTVRWAKEVLGISTIRAQDAFKFLYHQSIIGNRSELNSIKAFNKPLKGKKGSWLDVAFFVVIISGFAIALLIGAMIATSVASHFNAMDVMPQESKDFANKVSSRFVTANNGMFLVLVIGLMITSIALAALVRVHPVFIPFFFIALVFLTWAAGILSDAYQAMAATPELSASANQLVTVSLIMGKLPLFTAIIGFVIMIVMYKTWQT